jgi:transposase InsO family protein
MDTHQNAPLTPRGREMMVRAVVDRGLSKAAVARQFNTTPKTVAKWVDRFQAEGVEGLQDRSSRPLSLPSQTAPAICAAVEALRRQRHTAKQIAVEVGVSAATVSRILRRLGLNRLSALEPAEPIRRYERANPGELIHIDIKKLGRIGSVGHRMTGRKTGAINRHLGIGWEFVHVCIDDASRIAFSQVMKDERKSSAVAFLEAAVAHYASLGVKIERVMTDNGSCYVSRAFRQACQRLGLKHIRTRPYTPRTNGKAERFIQTSLREWAYAQAYNSSDERTAELPRWLHRYNWHRPHSSIGAKPPVSRLDLAEDNLLRLHS